MSERIDLVPVAGTWFRHVYAGVDGLAFSHGGNGGRFNPPDLPALYLADTEPTAWAEWYRWLSEWTRSPTEHLPRDLYRVTVELTAVADLRTMAARQRVAAPGRMRPTSAQWPPFQQLGARLAAEGAQGILYASAARSRSSCLCVFEAGLEHLRVDSEPVRVITPPPPPRRLRT
jgi:RES domain-containing protein